MPSLLNKKRILALDCGNKYTGIVLADVGEDTVEIIILDLYVDDTNMKTSLVDYLNEKIMPLMLPYDPCKTLILYEKVFYMNWNLLRVNGNTVKHFTSLGRTSMALSPSQKEGVVTGLNRKTDIVSEMRKWLYDNHPWSIEIFDSFERKHDVADALGMILYAKKYGFYNK